MTFFNEYDLVPAFSCIIYKQPTQYGVHSVIRFDWDLKNRVSKNARIRPQRPQLPPALVIRMSAPNELIRPRRRHRQRY